jgi:succinoglycan biosynthesis protein ExoA
MDIRPAISVVIPCRNEKDHIEACVRSLLEQEEPPGGFEIIIADGMSDDGTTAILQRLREQAPLLRVVDNLGQLTPCGMNLGIHAARGRYIAIMGAHNRYANDYLRQSVEVLEETGADNVGGSMFCEAERGWQHAIAAAHHSPFSVGGARWHNPEYEGPANTVFGGVYRREVFERIGLFDETLVRNQDDEFNLRLLRAGGMIWQSPRIRSWYKPRAGLADLFHQYRQYGYWKVRVIQKHKMPASIRHLVPGCFVLSMVVLPLVSFWWLPALWIWLAEVTVYSAVNAVVSSIAAASRGWKLFLLLPMVFASVHFGYGWGFLRGIIDFVVFRRPPTRVYSDLTRRSGHAPSADKLILARPKEHSANESTV